MNASILRLLAMVTAAAPLVGCVVEQGDPATTEAEQVDTTDEALTIGTCYTAQPDIQEAVTSSRQGLQSYLSSDTYNHAGCHSFINDIRYTVRGTAAAYYRGPQLYDTVFGCSAGYLRIKVLAMPSGTVVFQDTTYYGKDGAGACNNPVWLHSFDPGNYRIIATAGVITGYVPVEEYWSAL